MRYVASKIAAMKGRLYLDWLLTRSIPWGCISRQVDLAYNKWKVKKVGFLGVVIGLERIKMEEKKVKDILD